MIGCEILLVEDNSDDVELTRLAFEESKLCNEMVVARDGQEALDYLMGSEGRPGCDLLPSVVLLDLKLPKVDGMEVLRRIRGDPRTRCLPVIILTSSKEDEDVVTSYTLGANAYVRKPVDFNEFVEAARALGLFWLVLNQPPPRRRTCQ